MREERRREKGKKEVIPKGKAKFKGWFSFSTKILFIVTSKAESMCCES
jgi:hypothetical protein